MPGFGHGETAERQAGGMQLRELRDIVVLIVIGTAMAQCNKAKAASAPVTEPAHCPAAGRHLMIQGVVRSLCVMRFIHSQHTDLVSSRRRLIVGR